MTITLKARDMAMGVLLIITGIVLGLAVAAPPSQAQNVSGQASYLEASGRWWYCAGRDCVPVRFNAYS